VVSSLKKNETKIFDMSKKLTYVSLIGIFLFSGILSAQQDKTAADSKQEQKAPVKENRTAAQSVQNKDSKQQKNVILGFQDRDHDGKNDLFQDADGDGKNDITKKEYSHDFKFLDKNKDKINDIYVDADGDGVNDLDIDFIDTDSDGINDNIVDVNKDYINDITGLRYTKKSLRGYKYGFIKEERLWMMRGFIDEDGDGIADLPRGKLRRGRPGDMFIDRDGDGIDDRRGTMRKIHIRGRK
jgi:hypothetical protein